MAITLILLFLIELACHSPYKELIFLFVTELVILVQVEELLLEDSRIDQYPKVVKGEAKVVLEWQGTNLPLRCTIVHGFEASISSNFTECL